MDSTGWIGGHRLETGAGPNSLQTAEPKIPDGADGI